MQMTPDLSDRLGLLHVHEDNDALSIDIATGDVKNAVLFPAKLLADYNRNILPQYGLLGSCEMKESADSSGFPDPRIFLNINIPFSAFICEVQGSGKSHSTSCIIDKCRISQYQISYALSLTLHAEDCLIRSSALGVLQNPLSASILTPHSLHNNNTRSEC